MVELLAMSPDEARIVERWCGSSGLGDLEAGRGLRPLSRLVELRDEIEVGVAGTVRELRADGVSWARIGDALGVSKQAAWERYGKKRAGSREEMTTLPGL